MQLPTLKQTNKQTTAHTHFLAYKNKNKLNTQASVNKNKAFRFSQLWGKSKINKPKMKLSESKARLQKELPTLFSIQLSKKCHKHQTNISPNQNEIIHRNPYNQRSNVHL